MSVHRLHDDIALFAGRRAGCFLVRPAQGWVAKCRRRVHCLGNSIAGPTGSPEPSMTINFKRALLVAALSASITGTASAACVNRFVSRMERQMQVVTLLTGKITFQEAQTLAADIKSRKVP